MRNFFTRDRREVIARTLFETWKLALLLALASEFFIKYNKLVAVGGAVILFGLFMISAVIFPPAIARGRKGEE